MRLTRCSELLRDEKRWINHVKDPIAEIGLVNVVVNRDKMKSFAGLLVAWNLLLLHSGKLKINFGII